MKIQTSGPWDADPPGLPITETVRQLAEASGAYSRHLSGGETPLYLPRPLYDALAAAGADMKDLAVTPPIPEEYTRPPARRSLFD